MFMSAANQPAALGIFRIVGIFFLLSLSVGCGNRTVAENSVAVAPAASSPSELSSSDEGNWPVFRGNAQATGVAASHLVEQPALIWKFTVEKGAFESTPAVVDGVVYLGDMDGTFYALDLKSGNKLWTFNKGKDKAGFTAAAAVQDGLVYIGDMDGTFFCLDAKTGEKKWTADSRRRNRFGGKLLPR